LTQHATNLREHDAIGRQPREREDAEDEAEQQKREHRIVIRKNESRHHTRQGIRQEQALAPGLVKASENLRLLSPFR
jgi:predicted TIM-barrel fold metal-dependent hydrolase